MWDVAEHAIEVNGRGAIERARTARSRTTRCPHDERGCAARAAERLDAVAATGVAAIGICLARHHVVWTSRRTMGPVGAWVASTLRPGAIRSEFFPGFRHALDTAVKNPDDAEPVLTILPSANTPLAAQAIVTVVERNEHREPHLALVVVKAYNDPLASLPPFELAVHRSLAAGIGLEAAVTTADMRITWASPALEQRAGSGSLVGRVLLEVTSAQERDVLVDLARQSSHRRQGRPALSRALPTGRRASVLDRTNDPALAGLVWWWQTGSSAVADVDRLAQIESAVARFVDDLAWAGVDTARGATTAVGRLELAEGLTSREREILELLVTGLRVPLIAERLFITASTVRNHLSTGFKKLGVASQSEFLALVAVNSA